MEEFKIEGDYIELMALLKALGIAETGGHAKHIVDAGEVIRNGQIESRRRAKLIPGDQIQIQDIAINLK
ncbi:MAG: RNA-binding S4 domain-containing protein [Crocinitomicaceae bacterium]